MLQNHSALFILDRGDGKRDVDEPSVLREPDRLEMFDPSPSANASSRIGSFRRSEGAPESA